MFLIYIIAVIITVLAKFTASFRSHCLLHYKCTKIRQKLNFILQASTESEIIEHQKLFIGPLSKNLRGVKALEVIDTSKPLVTVASDAVLQVTNSRPPTPFPDFVPQDLWERSLWFQRLAFKLLYESSVRPSIEKATWFQQLPKSFTTPFHWDSKNLQELQYSSLSNKVLNQRNEWREQYELFISKTKIGTTVDFTKYVWALENVNSRAFSGVYEGSDAKDRNKLLAFTGLLALSWPILHLGTIEQALNGALVVASSILARDFVMSKSGTFKRYVLCPTIDMFNHRSNATSDVGYNYFSDSFELKVQQSYNREEQIFINYGKQSNDRFLQYYGFVEQDNPYDIYDFGENILSILVRTGDYLIENGATFATSGPSPKERLQTLAQLLRNSMVDSTTYQGEKSTSNQLATSKLTEAIQISMKFFRSPLPHKDAAVPEKPWSMLLRRFDDITIRSLRLMYCSESEYISQVSGKVNLDNLASPMSDETEKNVLRALFLLVRAELDEKATTLEEDVRLLDEINASTSYQLSQLNTFKSSQAENNKGFGTKSNKNSPAIAFENSEVDADPSGPFANNRYTSLIFRIEKKKLLEEIISAINSL